MSVSNRLPTVPIGSIEGNAEQLERQRERTGPLYRVVHDADLDGAEPVVERLAGT